MTWKEDYEKSITSRFVSKYRGTFGAFAISEFEDYSLKMDQLMIEIGLSSLRQILKSYPSGEHFDVN
uniref:Uncharacterized protein n=1 Tax=Schistosoma haematobium TaxID=6185 RepID=A0A094ZXL2_SCHHA